MTFHVQCTAVRESIAPQADEEVAPGVVRVLPMLAPDLDAEGVDPASAPLGHDLRLRLGPGLRRRGS